jgi:hypothetical protein
MPYLPQGLQIGEDGHALADAGEIVDRELHAACVRHGEQVQHGIGGAAERDGHA